MRYGWAGNRWIAAGLSCGLALLPALFSSSADAHHPIVPNGVNQALVANRLILTQSSAPFELSDAHGQWWRTSLAFELAPLDRLALVGAIGVATIRHQDGHQFTGPTDTDIGLKFALWSSHDRRITILLGAVAEFPSGDAYDRLGSGHYELTPSALLQWQPNRELSFLFALSDRFALADSSDMNGDIGEPSATTAHTGQEHPVPSPSETEVPIVPSHGALLAPHADHEAHITVNAGYRWQQLYASVENDFAIVFSEDDPIGPWVVTPELGVFPNDNIRVASRVTLPVAGPKRAQWVGALELTYVF